MEKEKLEALLADMSLEEKVGQLLQVAGNFLAEDALVTGALDYFNISQKELDLSGSVLSISGAKKLKDVQDRCMAKQPHHIPQIFMQDIINGFETIFPVPLAQGATFNPDMVEKMAEVAAKEGAAAGIHVTFSPMVDLVRDARWGRVMESTGEDVYLNGLMGAAMVRGYQGDDVSEKGRLAACVKHFAAYGAPEGGRDYDNVELSERTLKQDYLPGYEAAISAGAKLVMTSFNTLNRIPSSGNKWLMRKVLREDMKFDGVLISDYGAVVEMINHGFAKDYPQAAELAMKAGVDIEMMSLCYSKGLEQLVKEGKISEKEIDEATMRVLLLKNDLGLFENPYKDGNEAEEKALCLCKEHRQLALEAACESFVLLKNEEKFLPLEKNLQEKIALIGPYAKEKKVFGSWSFPSNIEDMVTIEEGFASAGMADLQVAAGSPMLGFDFTFKNGEKHVYDEVAAAKMLEEAVEVAKKADKVVLCLGEHNQQTGEAASRTKIVLDECQLKLLRAVKEVNDNIVTIVFAGRPIELQEVSALSKAVLLVWFPGNESGNAIAQVLLGQKEPGGRLPMSFPYTTGQMPCYYNRFRTGRPNDGTLDRGYVMGYIDQIDRMLYPFGYGKTYTEFSYSAVKLSANTMKQEKDAAITASISLTNTGSVEGTETVQMYISDLFGNVVRPSRELKGFKKVRLQPGETQEVTFKITEEMLRFYNIDMEYKSEPGDFKVYIGPDSMTENQADFELR